MAVLGAVEQRLQKIYRKFYPVIRRYLPQAEEMSSPTTILIPNNKL
jgi:hypothetical protein